MRHGPFEPDAAAWWTPQSFGLALGVALLSTACWGSWSNTAKAAGDRVNFAHYYTDFCLGTVLTAVLFLLGPGGTAVGGADVDTARIGFAVAAGSVFGVANLLLTTGIALVGLSIAFPLCIGTGLVLGTVLTYLVDQRGHPELIFPGVFVALLGILSNARAYALLHTARQAARSKAKSQDSNEDSEPELSSDTRESATCSASDTDNDKEPAEASLGMNILLCVVGGLLMGCWSPLSAKSMRGDEGLSPYFSFVFFTAASLVVGLLIISGQQCNCSVMPRVGPVTSLREYFKLPALLHLWGLLGGVIWAIGTLSNLVSGKTLSFALSYALGQTAPVVAVLWGLLWYHEFDGAPRKAVAYLVAMFFFFAVAIAMLCIGGH